MKKFILSSVLFITLLVVLSEGVIRIFRLVPDIPERSIDKYGIQRYKPGQSGYFTKAKSKWHVNKYGWLGTSDTDKDTIVSIIGDSYIENIMNPVKCNQGSILASLLQNYSFFEAGRSGITFIEAMEISKILDIEIKPKFQLLYLSSDDFYESISEITRYTDRLQISIKTQKLLPNSIKSPKLKKILYEIKLLYYLYLKYPIFVARQNKGEVQKTVNPEEYFDSTMFSKLFSYCSNKYNFNKLIFVFHPNTDDRIIALAIKNGIKTITLNSSADKMWDLGKHDGHWSCYGHEQVSAQVKTGLNKIVKLYMNRSQ